MLNNVSNTLGKCSLARLRISFTQLLLVVLVVFQCAWLQNEKARRSRVPNYRYQPKQVDAIIVREFAFEFPDDLDPVWMPQHVVRSHLFNGISLTMPYLFQDAKMIRAG
jgi:hypothetical protein